MIKVIDLFAGPGGLGEGFSSFRGSNGHRFELAVSIEKDAVAHRTLRLRAFARRFQGQRLPAAYYAHLNGEIDWQALAAGSPAEAQHAEREALNLALGPETVDAVRTRIRAAIGRIEDFILIGGPPCQAYSLVGRARRRGNADYSPEADERQTLYVEYLQILADHAPPAFVMENVKGLLSAQLDSRGMFDRIREDLHDPARALLREGRRTGNRHPRYELRALVADERMSADDPRRYVVRAEDFGVPQRRHRVILVGVRSDFAGAHLPTLIPAIGRRTVDSALRGLPRLRSGLSKLDDANDTWLGAVRSAKQRRWITRIDADVRAEILDVLEHLSVPKAGRGAEYIDGSQAGLVLNHSTRGHIVADLDRYLFSSCFAKTRGVSPVLADFPRDLLPSHTNIRGDATHAVFTDRFRTQVAGEPSTTITAHISKDGHYYIHPDPSQCRSLTVREAARLQTFPDHYFFCGPRTSQYQQVGNAVPPLLAQQIAKSVAALF